MSPVLLALAGWAVVHAACVAYVQLRGKVRHTWHRQLTDHSTLLAPYNALVYAFSGVPRTPRLDPAMLPDLAMLTEHWTEIRDDALRLRDAGHIRESEWKDDLSFNTFYARGWTRFHVVWYGSVLPSAQRLCPRTVELVRSVPGVRAALFAVLPPHSRLGRHRDPFAGSLRYHLGLLTPNRDECFIAIDGTPCSWRDGEALLFDETYLHNARNDTDEDRVILFCDVERPIRNPVVRAINRFVARTFLPLVRPRNEEGERVGLLNRFANRVLSTRARLERLKKRSRGTYYFVKYAVFTVLLAAVVFVVARFLL